MTTDAELIAGTQRALAANANRSAIARAEVAKREATRRSLERDRSVAPRHEGVVGAHDVALLTADHGLVTIQVVDVASNSFRRVLDQPRDSLDFGSAENEHPAMRRRAQRKLGLGQD